MLRRSWVVLLLLIRCAWSFCFRPCLWQHPTTGLVSFNQSNSQSIKQSTNQSIKISINSPIYIYLSIYLSIHLSINQSIYLGYEDPMEIYPEYALPHQHKSTNRNWNSKLVIKKKNRFYFQILKIFDTWR